MISMGRLYSHLSEEDRIFLGIMLEKNYSKSKIAKVLRVDRSTIYREIKRNSCIHAYSRRRYYFCNTAQRCYLKRRKRPTKLSVSENLRQYVEDKLSRGWSPGQIEGRLRRENASRSILSHETIYRYIYSDYILRNRFYKKLRRKHMWRVKRHARKQRIPVELLIKNRPETTNKRDDFGHWEGDLMIFKRGHGTANLITLRERKSRLMIAIKNKDKSASGTALALISSTKNFKAYIKSITFDQGGEFLKYPWIKDCLRADIYFCDPASPHQKGAIENGNGVIRAELPRAFNITGLKQKELNAITNEINNRPLKCLEYQTPTEVFLDYTRGQSGSG